MDLDEIIKLAENLASAHRGEYGGDPMVLLRDYDVPFIEADFGDSFEGLTRFHKGEFEVFLNLGGSKGKSAGRSKFTVAHEIGHLSIGEHRNAIRYGTGVHRSESGFISNNSMEREADIFASHFLAPTDSLLKRCKKNPQWGAGQVIDVANKFGISRTCAALRCQAALPGHSTVIYWQDNAVAWQRMNTDWWFELPAKAIRKEAQLAAGSATQRILAGEEVGEEGYFMNGTTRSAWFPRVLQWARHNDLLIEYAIPLGSHGVLTLLRPDSSDLLRVSMSY